MGTDGYKIRKLTRKDRKVFASLIKKLADTSKSESLLNIISNSSGDVSVDKDDNSESIKSAYMEIGISLLNSMIDLLDTDIAVWFSDLIGVSVDEFDTCPFGIELIISEQILESDEIADFFSSASRVYNLIQKFQPLQKNVKVK